MKIAFCDDDQLILDILAPQIENLIDKNNIYKFHFEYYCFTRATELIKQHTANPFDIVFLDIEMPDTNGFAVADQLYKQNNSVFIFYVTSYTTYTSIKKLALELPPIFYRCHSSFIVNLSHVLSVGTNDLTLDNHQKIPVSRQHKQEVIHAFLHYNY